MLIVIKTKILLPQLYVTSVEGSPSSAICELSRRFSFLSYMCPQSIFGYPD